MDSESKLYIERAENELVLSEAIFNLSYDDKLKTSFKIQNNMTFYSAVINHAYYCIFYSAKALLLLKDIKTESPEEHRKTMLEFEKLAESGFIDKKLIQIYKDLSMKADALLNIFAKEKSKRGQYTYKKLPQANMNPAKESIFNAKIFFKNINAMLEKS